MKNVVVTAALGGTISAVTESLSFFTTCADPAELIPTEWATSAWSSETLNGPAICGAAARALELEFGGPDFVPARFTIDLYKAAKNLPTVFRTRQLRAGRRIVLADVEVTQHDVAVARATVVYLRKSSAPPGAEWVPAADFYPPERMPTDNESTHPWLNTDRTGWTQSIAEHQNADRKRAWGASLPVVPGEPASPFVHAVQSAESASLVTNLGTAGIGYINCDVTMAISRLPEGLLLGVEADNHITADGISVGTATLYDDRGSYGTSVVTALSNAAVQVDFSRSPSGQ